MLVNARLDHNTSIDRSRAERLLFFARQHRPVPIMLSAYNAHTGRYTAGAAEDGGSSDKLQFQNLSKRDPSKAKLRQAIHAPAGYKVVACDSSQVEARCLAWEANETGLVEQFREGRDPYSELAEMIFQVPHEEIHYGAKHGDKRLKMYRNVGKTAILSAGYGVGATKFSDTLARQGARLSEDSDKHREMAFNAHAIYRAAHPNIVRFWNLCSNVIKDMEAGYSGRFGGPDGTLFEFGTKEMGDCGRQVPYVMLPNGYHLWYPGLRVENDGGKVQYVYDRPRGKNMVKTKLYGGSLTENITQSFAFMVLAWQACRMHEAGIRLAANIHDSFATVVPEDEAEETAKKMEHYMNMCPEWASTLPIACESEIGRDFGVV